MINNLWQKENYLWGYNFWLDMARLEMEAYTKTQDTDFKNYAVEFFKRAIINKDKLKQL